MARNTNNKLVVVRQDRVCCYCNKKIPAGSKCLTINKKYKGRSWACKDCVSCLKEISRSSAAYELVPFDDEGGAMALHECLEEAIGEFYERTGVLLDSAILH